MYKLMPQSRMSWHFEEAQLPSCERGSRRAPDRRPVRTTRPTPCYVYLLVHRLSPRFKIGVSVDPQVRARGLPDAEHIAEESSLKALFSDRRRAMEIEKSLHKLLSGFRLRIHGEGPERWDGGTEWFSIDGLSHAVNLLSQTPLGDEQTTLVTLTTLADESYTSGPRRLCHREAQTRRWFEATHANLRQMNEIVKALRKLNDNLDIVLQSAPPARPTQRGFAEQGETGASGEPLAAQPEVVYLYGLGDLWESEMLSSRFQMSDSAFWMFRTGRLRQHGEQRSWLTRIHFDPDSRGTLALWVEDRLVLRALPGGPRMLALWDGLWEG
jgi:hypothetical protein